MRGRERSSTSLALRALVAACGAALLLPVHGCSSSSSSPDTDGGPEPDAGPGMDSGRAQGDDGAPHGTDGGDDSATSDAATASPESSTADGGSCPYPSQVAAPSCLAMYAGFAPTPVVTTCPGGSPPQGQGGTIADGVYRLADRVAFDATCPAGAADLPRQATIVICGNRWAWAQIFPPQDAGQVSATYIYDYTWTSTQSALVLTPHCTSDSSNVVNDLQYTYAAGQLTLISASAVSTFVKQ